jgi:hypothetical protein
MYDDIEKSIKKKSTIEEKVISDIKKYIENN